MAGTATPLATAVPVPPGELVPRLDMVGIDKSFPGVRALKCARLRLRAGEIHVLMGQNGAGKSTLIQVLTGVHRPDAGEIILDGRPIRPSSPLHAQTLGISTVFQEVNLCPNVSVAENILIGRMPRRFGLLDWQAARRQAAAILESLQIHVDVARTLGDYPVAVQQMVAIARAVSADARVLILDEPSSSLDEAETGQLFNVMRQLKARGVAILFITHFLDQAYAMADRITVMRNGETVGEFATAALPKLALVGKMVGRVIAEGELETVRRPQPGGAHPQVLSAQGLGRRGSVHPMDLDLRAGEVYGLAGLLGSGRTETARLLFGVELADRGGITLRGRSVRLRSPRDAVRADLGFCPEDRKTDGIVADLSLRENIILALQAKRGVFHHIPWAEREQTALKYIAALGIQTAGTDTPIGQLSGGNQQKAVIARWLAAGPMLLILDEPTRGIDVAAKQEIMDQVLRLCESGMSIVFISAEIGEVLRVSDRVAVLRDRRKVAEFPSSEVDEQRVLRIIAEHATTGAAGAS
jgi:simple sugar transport system ATP-binding protein